MFYVKERMNERVNLTLGITDDNVYTKCPRCGKEVKVNLGEVFKVGDVDLFETVVLCAECSERVRGREKDGI